MLKIMTIVILLVLVFIFNLIISRFTHYECPNCGKHFQTNGTDLFKPHFAGERQETCPNCGETTLMRRHSGKD